jgi:hypothetical protein
MATVETSLADKYQILTTLDPETYDALKANISIHGVKVTIVWDEAGLILDGVSRARIAEELGYECPETVVVGLSEAGVRWECRFREESCDLTKEKAGEGCPSRPLTGYNRTFDSRSHRPEPEQR